VAEEQLTDELLERLLASASPEAYLSTMEPEDRTLSEYLFSLLHDKGLSRSEVFEAAGIDRTHGYQIFEGIRNVGRDRAIMLAFGLRCSLRETQHLLRFAGVAELWCKVRRDAIIIYCIEHGFDRTECDDTLYRMGERTLLPED
jgi:transcriptional regulator with XRE-family HTH domain